MVTVEPASRAWDLKAERRGWGRGLWAEKLLSASYTSLCSECGEPGARKGCQERAGPAVGLVE